MMRQVSILIAVVFTVVIGSTSLSAQALGGEQTWMVPCPRMGILGSDIHSPYLSNSHRVLSGEGALVLEVMAGSGAEKGGVAVNDIVVSFLGERIVGIAQLRRLVQTTSPGDTVVVEIVRAGTPLSLSIEIGEQMTLFDCSGGPAARRNTELLYRFGEEGLGTLEQSLPSADTVVRENLQNNLRRLSWGSMAERYRRGGNSDSSFASCFRAGQNILEQELRYLDSSAQGLSILSRRKDSTQSRLFRSYGFTIQENLGVTVQSIPDQLARFFHVPDGTGGLLVSEVKENHAAFRAGIQAGDILLRAAESELNTPADLLTSTRLRGEVNITVLRNGEVLVLTVNIRSEPTRIESIEQIGGEEKLR